ncbi:6-phosphogluconolactonase [Schleiferiaceae bacterium]|nr:6-phosphogluconolactonase [Schleiferiaceae bacterium]
MKNNFEQISVNEREFYTYSAEYLYSKLRAISKNKRNISIALSGGLTPLPILSILKEYKLNWEYFNFFMVDERNVSVSSPSSNYGNIARVFFKDINCASYSMIKDSYSIEECALNYEKLLCSKVPSGENGFPIFDLILLGIGNDGHTASLFPHTVGLDESNKVVITNIIPQLSTERITLSYPVILSATKVVILTKGDAKNKILEEIEMGNGSHYPIARIINSDVDTTCISAI